MQASPNTDCINLRMNPHRKENFLSTFLIFLHIARCVYVIVSETAGLSQNMWRVIVKYNIIKISQLKREAMQCPGPPPPHWPK
jgi:hypothetical protein